ncbi:MAG: hypothetical protein MZV70_20975, partial [Desulfobacterales bacterium]|nr:hypothetical protein [Desulfobacterales bacterium]
SMSGRHFPERERKIRHARRPRPGDPDLAGKSGGTDRPLSAGQAARLLEAALPRAGRLFRAGLRKEHDRTPAGNQQEPLRHHRTRRLWPGGAVPATPTSTCCFSSASASRPRPKA